MKGLEQWRVIVTILASIGVTSDDDDRTRLQKTILIVATVIISATALVWGTLYLFVYTPLAASVPLLYALFSFINLILLRKNPRYEELGCIRVR